MRTRARRPRTMRMPVPRWIAHSASILDEAGPAPSQLPRLIAEHKNSADKLVQSRRVRRELLSRYSGLLTGMDMRVRTSIEQALKTSTRSVARDPLLEVRAQLDAVRAAFAARSSFDGRELETGPLAVAERTLTTTLRDRSDGLCVGHRARTGTTPSPSTCSR